MGVTDWKAKQRACKRCRGLGYVRSEMRHADGRGQAAWAALCECQPRTLPEMQEAAEQEREARPE
jgi:hypothetical protein